MASSGQHGPERKGGAILQEDIERRFLALSVSAGRMTKMCIRDSLQNMFHNKDTRTLMKLAAEVPYIPCNRVSYLADVINIVTKHTASSIRSTNQIKKDVYKRQEKNCAGQKPCGAGTPICMG